MDGVSRVDLRKNLARAEVAIGKTERNGMIGFNWLKLYWKNNQWGCLEGGLCWVSSSGKGGQTGDMDGKISDQKWRWIIRFCNITDIYWEDMLPNGSFLFHADFMLPDFI